MNFLNEMHIDFMKWRRFWILVSLVVILIGMGALFVEKKLNIGIDFAGGTQITIQFKDRPDVDALRTLLEQEGMREAVIQRYGPPEANQVMLRVATLEGTEEGSGAKLVQDLVEKFDPGIGPFDLNRKGSLELTALLVEANPDGVGPDMQQAHYAGVAQTVLDLRKQRGLVTDWSQIEGLSGVSPATARVLKERTSLGNFSILSLENVGPQVGSELRRRGELAVVFSLIGMMAYIWFRFELRFGIGAIMASIHDVLVTLGLFTLAGYEFNLTTIAAFLTLVGYSTNDTVVVFDRVRENMRKTRAVSLIDLMNQSINQTLSRTLLTSGLTFVASLALFVLGGDVIRGFAFIMTVGVVVGTYSSIYIASPFALLWETWFGAEGKFRKSGAAAKPGKPEPAPVSTTPRKRSRR